VLRALQHSYHMSMVPRRPVVAAALLSICLAAPTRAQTTRELRDRATDLAYNLDHDEAIRLLHQAIAAAPPEAANHRALAALTCFTTPSRRGPVGWDHYRASFTRATADVKTPPKELDAEFKRESARAVELAEQRVAAAPKDAGAHFDLGTALGLQATYTASV